MDSVSSIAAHHAQRYKSKCTASQPLVTELAFSTSAVTQYGSPKETDCVDRHTHVQSSRFLNKLGRTKSRRNLKYYCTYQGNPSRCWQKSCMYIDGNRNVGMCKKVQFSIHEVTLYTNHFLKAPSAAILPACGSSNVTKNVYQKAIDC